jgi:hypothetical protein
MRRFLVVLGIVALCSAPVWADSISTPVYDVSGSMTFTGNPVCSGRPCSETINFSLVYGYILNPSLDIYQGYVESGTISSFGALGGGFNIPNSIVGSGCGAYIGFFDGPPGAGSEIDLNTCGGTSAVPLAPSFGGADLYSCGTQTCENDFVPPSMDRPNPSFGLFINGTEQTTVTAVPDGDSAILLSLGALGAVGLVWRWRRREA